MNVTYENDEFDGQLVRLLLVIPMIPLETTISLSVATLGLHKFSADRLKLTKTPTCTSKHPLRGIIIGSCEHVGSGRT